jgi:prepilin-type N-terminal cleavage/methylation domain-containing protein
MIDHTESEHLTIDHTAKDRKGVTLIELLVVVLIVSVLAAVVQPQLTGVITKARAADAISNMQSIRVAAYTFQSEQQAWPSETGGGVVPTGLEDYLPDGFDLVQDDYTLDYDYWGGSPFTLGVTLVTTDSILGRTALEMLASPKWTAGNKYTWVIE